LVSFDDLPGGASRDNTASTIGQPVYDMGAAAAGMLLDRVQGFDGPAHEVQLPLHLAKDSATRRIAAVGPSMSADVTSEVGTPTGWPVRIIGVSIRQADALDNSIPSCSIVDGVGTTHRTVLRRRRR
jgi:hypothetical protein